MDTIQNLVPATPVIVGVEIICGFIWLYIYYYSVDSSKILFNYDRIIEYKEWWRIVTGTLSHIQIMHLCVNMVSLWNTRSIELQFGSITYLELSFCFFMLSNVCMLCVYWIMSAYFHKSEYVKNLFVCGYSAILFGFSSFDCMRFDGRMSLFGFEISFYFGPFLLLILISLLVPNASFVGHSAGIFCGFLLGSKFYLNDLKKISILFWILFVSFVAIMIWSIFRTDLFVIASNVKQKISETKTKTKLVNGVIVRETV